MVLLTSAGAGLLILGSYLAYRSAMAAKPVAPPAIVDDLNLDELKVLPEPLQAGAQAVLAGTFQLPAWRQSIQGSGPALLSPVREAVEDLQPVLRWSGETQSANVAVLSSTHQVAARAEVFRSTEWTVPVELERGAIYTWEVARLGQVSRNSFRVIDETELGWLQALRAAGQDKSHLVMGMAFLEIGVLTQAQHEFQELAQEHPHSPKAAKLLQMVEGFIR